MLDLTVVLQCRANPPGDAQADTDPRRRATLVPVSASGGSLAQKSLLIFASTWITTLLGLAASIVVARRLGPAAVGSLAFGLGFGGLVLAVLAPGFGQAHLRRLAEGEDAGRCIGTMTLIQVVLAGALGLVIAVSWLAVKPPETSELVAVAGLMAAAQVLGSFADILLRVFFVREWIVQHALILVGGRLLRFVLVIAVLWGAPRVTLVAATFVVEAISNIIVAGAALARHGIRARQPTRQSLLDYWRYTRPFLVITPLALFQDSIDRVLVARWAGLAAAGYYHVARALWEALSSVLAPPGMFVLTRLSAILARRSADSDREAREFFFGTVDKMFFVTMPLCFLFWVCSEALIAIVYGPSFVAATTALRILVLATVASTVINPYTFVLYALDQARRLVPVNVLRVAVYLGLLWWLVPPRPWLQASTGLAPGETGAALARLLLLLFPAWLYWRWTRQEVAIPFYGRIWAYLTGFVLMLVAFHALIALARAVLPLDLWVIVAATGAALGLYLAYLLKTHPGTMANLRYTLALCSPAGFIRFLRGGLRGPEHP